MNARRFVLLAVAIAGIGAALWLGRTPAPDQGDAGKPEVLSGLKAKLNEVTQVVLSRSDGGQVTLSRTAETWIVAERGYAADVARIRRLLLDLAGLEVVEQKTSNPKNYARLGVEDTDGAQATGTRVEVSAGDASFGLIVGKSAAGRGVYVRETGATQALLVTPALNVETDAAQWLDRELLDLPKDRIAEITVTPAKGNTYALKGDAAGSRFSYFAPLTFDDVARVADGAVAGARPRAVIRTTDGLAITLSGREADNQRWISVAAAATGDAAAATAAALAAHVNGFEFRVPEYRYQELFQSQD